MTNKYTFQYSKSGRTGRMKKDDIAVGTEEEMNFIMEKLKEKNSVGKHHSFKVIEELAQKAGFSEIKENRLRNFASQFKGSLIGDGIVLGSVRNDDSGKLGRESGNFREKLNLNKILK